MKQRLAPGPVPLTTRPAPIAAASTRVMGAAGPLRASIALVCLLGTSEAARAQETPAPPATEAPAAPQTPPAPQPPVEPQPPPLPQPPPNYPPPPPAYPPQGYGPYGPAYFPAVQQQRSPYRPFTLGLGLGVGTLSFRDPFGKRVNDPGLSYTLRVGFGITSRWLVFLGVEGTGVNHVEAGVWQTAYLLGVQCFVVEHLYLRAGIGLASATAEGINDTTGQALMAAAGFEFAQGYSTSMAVELSYTGARYPGENWGNGGLNFVLSFF
jgi:opacity protein-like surface antigen